MAIIELNWNHVFAAGGCLAYIVWHFVDRAIEKRRAQRRWW